MRARLADPFTRTAVVLVAVAAVGAVAVGLAWRGSAATLGVWVQLPFVISGGLVGAALIVTGLGLLGVHLDRQAAADEAALLDRIVRDAAELVRLVDRPAPVAAKTPARRKRAAPRRRAPVARNAR